MEKRPKKLLDQVRQAIRVKHYSIRTEEAYVNWIKRYILFHNKRHPQEMGVSEIEAFLTHLAVQQNVATSTQNQALSALLFLYRRVGQTFQSAARTRSKACPTDWFAPSTRSNDRQSPTHRPTPRPPGDPCPPGTPDWPRHRWRRGSLCQSRQPDGWPRPSRRHR